MFTLKKVTVNFRVTVTSNLVLSIGKLLDGERFKEPYRTGLVFRQTGDGGLDFISRWGMVELQHLINKDRLVLYPLRGFV